MSDTAPTFILQVQRTTHRIGVHLEHVGGAAIGQAEAHVLAQLAADGPATIGDIHRAFAHKRSTLTSILDRLEAQGLIVRASDARDRRSFVVTLTADGRRTGRRVLAHLQAFEAAILARVNPADLRGFYAVLAALEEPATSSAAKPPTGAASRVRPATRSTPAGRRGR